jgi:uncharacterized protein (UPF0335 family)
MSFEKIPYDKQRLEAFRIRLENHERVGDPIYYAVKIDDMEIIPKTGDSSLFPTLYELLGEQTKSISISEYIGDTRNRNVTCFYFAPIPTNNNNPNNNSALNGIEIPSKEMIDEQIQKGIYQESVKKERDQARRDNQTLKGQLNALLDKCDKLEEEKKNLENEKKAVEEENSELKKLQDENSETKLLLTLGKEAIHAWMGKNKPENPLAGTEQPDGTRQAEQGKTNSEEPTHVAVPENEYKDYKFFTALFEKFNSTHRGLISQLICALSEHPELVEEATMNVILKTQQNDNKEN